MDWLPVLAFGYIVVSAGLVLVLAGWITRRIQAAQSSGLLLPRPKPHALAGSLFLLAIGIGMFVWVLTLIVNGEVHTGRHHVNIVRRADAPFWFWLEVAMRYFAALVCTALVPTTGYRRRP